MACGKWAPLAVLCWYFSQRDFGESESSRGQGRGALFASCFRWGPERGRGDMVGGGAARAPASPEGHLAQERRSLLCFVTCGFPWGRWKEGPCTPSSGSRQGLLGRSLVSGRNVVGGTLAPQSVGALIAGTRRHVTFVAQGVCVKDPRGRPPGYQVRSV